MKLVMDEKLKHRLIGLAVVLSLGAIFAPAIMKKSSQNPGTNYSVTIKLPPKPLAPEVVSTKEAELFKTIKVSKVKIPSVTEPKQLTELVKAEPIHNGSPTIQNKDSSLAKIGSPDAETPVRVALNQEAQSKAKQSIKLAAIQKAKPVVTAGLKQSVPSSKMGSAQLAMNKPGQASKKDIYAVQLASFIQLSNAQALVNKLHSKGYKANFIKTKGKKGALYKVYVGHSPSKVEVVKLKSQLASAMQLNGFVVNTGVS